MRNKVLCLLKYGGQEDYYLVNLLGLINNWYINKKNFKLMVMNIIRVNYK